jgi:hypothetical protein
LRLPKRNSPTYTTEDNLIVEKVNLRDSLFRQTELKVALMAPFRLPTVPIDSVAQTNQILQTRNLQTISLDFYAGARLAYGRPCRTWFVNRFHGVGYGKQ